MTLETHKVRSRSPKHRSIEPVAWLAWKHRAFSSPHQNNSIAWQEYLMKSSQIMEASIYFAMNYLCFDCGAGGGWPFERTFANNISLFVAYLIQMPHSLSYSGALLCTDVYRMIWECWVRKLIWPFLLQFSWRFCHPSTFHIPHWTSIIHDILEYLMMFQKYSRIFWASCVN